MLIAIGVATVLAGSSARTSVRDIGWIRGCWSLTEQGRSVTEHWMPPDGGTMLGMSRTVKAGRTSEYEFLLIREGARGLEYVAKPSGQAEAVFTATRVTTDEVVFENPAHDFPTRIAYRKRDDGLTAMVGGTLNGKPRTIEFAYKTAACGS
jgi:hypothetical protein